MEEKDLQNLRSELGFDGELRAVFNVISNNEALGYSEIGHRSKVTGMHLDRALVKLSELGAVEKRRQEDKVLGDHDYYLRLVEL